MFEFKNLPNCKKKLYTSTIENIVNLLFLNCRKKIISCIFLVEKKFCTYCNKKPFVLFY